MTCSGISNPEAVTSILSTWQNIWDHSKKGMWTYKFQRNVTERSVRPLQFGHYIAQIITGHGDYNDKLHSFKLVNDPLCRCGLSRESADHLLWHCTAAANHRSKLKTQVEKFTRWPCKEEDFAREPVLWTALERFAQAVHISKEKDRAQLRLQQNT